MAEPFIVVHGARAGCSCLGGGYAAYRTPVAHTLAVDSGHPASLTHPSGLAALMIEAARA
jgi:hypothetical protein